MFVEIVILWLTGYEVDFLKVLRTFAISGLEASFHFGEFSRATKWWAIWACMGMRNPSWKRAFTGERAVSSGIWIKFNFFTTRMSESQSDCFFSIVRWIFFKFQRRNYFEPPWRARPGPLIARARASTPGSRRCKSSDLVHSKILQNLCFEISIKKKICKIW